MNGSIASKDFAVSESTAAGSSSRLGGVWIKTFGCQMNEYDSEKMLSLLSADYRPVSSAEEAQLVIVNTCSVREKAAHKLYSLLGKLRILKNNNPQLVIGVAGCVAQQEGESIVRRSSGVDFVVGTHNLSLVPALVSRVRAGFPAQVAVDYRDEWEELPDECDGFSEAAVGSADQLVSSGIRALVAIQRGCDKMCSFCVVPNTRGSQVSRCQEEILKEIRLKARLGAQEVLLLGQTVNSYGIDLSPRVRFEDLIKRVAEIDGIKRIRFTSPHPAEVKPGFIKLYSEVPQLCPHIHLPLQSGSDRILQLMNRNYRVKRYLQIVDKLREARPDIAISADIIVGFPSETDSDFEETLEVMRRVRYNTSYSFKYSPRPHTVALERFGEIEAKNPDLVKNEVASERLKRLQALQDELSEAYHKQLLGGVFEVLVERKNNKNSASMRGRTGQNTIVEIHGGNPGPGKMVEVCIDRASTYGVRGRMLDSTC